MARKVLFFLAGSIATADEIAKIANIEGNVQLRNAAANTLYGANLETADALAGAIPAAYKTASGGTAVDMALYPGGDVTPNNVSGIDGVFVFPVNIAITGIGTLQARAIKVEVDPNTGVTTATEITGSCVWSSATTSKATVNAGTGLVTGVAAGTSVITASYDYDGAGSHAPITATALATVS